MSVNDLLNEANEAMQSQDFKTAISKCTSALKLDSACAQALRQRAFARTSIKDYLGATRDSSVKN
jgi:hypothetical protein